LLARELGGVDVKELFYSDFIYYFTFMTVLKEQEAKQIKSYGKR